MADEPTPEALDRYNDFQPRMRVRDTWAEWWVWVQDLAGIGIDPATMEPPAHLHELDGDRPAYTLPPYPDPPA